MASPPAMRSVISSRVRSPLRKSAASAPHCPCWMIDPPAHPSFPSGHALQGRIISLVLKDVRGVLPQANELLDELAERVALNRTIAGLHYPLDNKAGVAVADEVHRMLQGGTEFDKLVTKAKDELYK